ncbi:MAG: 50S ribosomal protein L35 [Chlamydiae bacterium]|nr:MAG: 50S ribosomal protein L35 [Chlamydiota bacterium]
MPKVKTRKAVSKRFRVTKNGKVVRSSSKKRHLLTCKSRKKKRDLRQPKIAAKQDSKNIIKMLPYA